MRFWRKMVVVDFSDCLGLTVAWEDFPVLRRQGAGSDCETANNCDLYTAFRSTLAGAFSDPLPVRELITAAGESDPWVSADDNYIVFSRTTGGGIRDIFEATR